MGTPLGQFVYFNTSPWYGARLALQLLGSSVQTVTPGRVTTAKHDAALLLSFLSAREYPALFEVLRHARVPLYARDRGASDPLVIVGGGACMNPEPMADFVDVVCVGDGEAFLTGLPQALSYPTRAARLDAVRELPGAYLPGERTFTYEGGILVRDVSGDTSNILPAVNTTWYPPPPAAKGQSPEIELARGCRGTCFFCTIAWTTPYRERPQDQAETDLTAEALAFFAPNIGGVSYYADIAHRRGKATKGDVRVDDYLRLPMPQPGDGQAQRVTFGIEGITPRLRRLLGKRISDEILGQLFQRLITARVQHAQLYFIRGVPGESQADWDAFERWIEQDVHMLLDAGIPVEIQLTPLTRQPHTPLQWVAHPYNRESEARTKALVDRARKAKARDAGSLLYVTPSRREASWLVDVALNCGSRQTGKFLQILDRGFLGSLHADAGVGFGTAKVRWALVASGIDPDLLLADWPVEAVLPWSHLQPLGEAGERHRRSAYEYITRAMRAGVAGD